MAGLRYGQADKYDAIDMPVDDFADLAEKLMGGSNPEDE